MEPVNGKGRRPARSPVIITGMERVRTIGLESGLTCVSSAVGSRPRGRNGMKPVNAATLLPVTDWSFTPSRRTIYEPYPLEDVFADSDDGLSVQMGDTTRHLTITLGHGPLVPSKDVPTARTQFMEFLKAVSEGHNPISSDQFGKTLNHMDGFPPGDQPIPCNGEAFTTGTYLAQMRATKRAASKRVPSLKVGDLMLGINGAAQEAYKFALNDFCPKNAEQYCDHIPPEQGFVYAFAVGFWSIAKEGPYGPTSVREGGGMSMTKVVYAMAQVAWGCKEYPGTIYRVRVPSDPLPPSGPGGTPTPPGRGRGTSMSGSGTVALDQDGRATSFPDAGNPSALASVLERRIVSDRGEATDAIVAAARLPGGHGFHAVDSARQRIQRQGVRVVRIV